jgi:hypothetical protein
LEGTTEGHAQAIDISRRLLKGIIDSTRGLKPSDVSPEARAARTVSLREFEGMTFMGKIGIEKGKPKNDGSGEFWPDKNVLLGAVTPDKDEWRPSEQPPPFNGGDDAADRAAELGIVTHVAPVATEQQRSAARPATDPRLPLRAPPCCST